MKNILNVFVLLFLFSFLSFAQDLTPAEIVEKQLKAYNERNIDDFLNCFSDQAAVFELGDTVPRIQGKIQLMDVYGSMFEKSKGLNSLVLNRTVIGNRVIDYERISGISGKNEDVFLIMIYEVSEGKIVKAFVLRE